jgi:predicted DNA-binding transcriptional regulator YafY
MRILIAHNIAYFSTFDLPTNVPIQITLIPLPMNAQSLRSDPRLKRLNDLDAILNKTVGHQGLRTSEILIMLRNKGNEVSKRTLQLDLQEMTEEGGYDHLDVTTEGKANIYRYTKIFSRRQDELTHQELERLRSAMTILESLSLYDMSEQIKTKINALDSDTNIVELDSNPEYKNAKGVWANEFFPSLFQYILDKQPLKLSYQAYDKPKLTHIMMPYRIKQFNQRWYLCGLSKKRSESRLLVLAFDRILDFQPHKTDFIPCPPYFDRDYFTEVIGVTVPRDIAKETITFQVSNGRHHYVRTKRLHESQWELDQPNTFSITVKPNPELFSLLLSFGADLEVLSPAQIRRKLKETALAMSMLYGAEVES